MEVLFHQLRLDYQVPIISQQGEVCGKLHVEVYRLGYENVEETDKRESFSSESNESINQNNRIETKKILDPADFLGKVIHCRVIYIFMFNILGTY